MEETYQSYLVNVKRARRFHSAQGAANVGRPADKDWPLLPNLGRNFFFLSLKRWKSLDMIRRKEEKNEKEEEEGD